MSMTLRAWRRARDITQEEMAEHCGVHPNTYRYWEEHTEAIKLSYAKMIAERLKVDIKDIDF